MAEKTEQVTMKDEIQQTIDELARLEVPVYMNKEYLLLIANLAAFKQIAAVLGDLSANIDRFIAERIESDKVIIGLLKQMQDDPIEDQEPDDPD